MLQFDGNNNLLTVSPRTLAQAGFTFMAGTGLGGAVATSPVRPLAASTSGRLLLEEDAIDALHRDLMPLCRLVTPNLLELATLTQSVLAPDEEAACRQGKQLSSTVRTTVLVKGGHAQGSRAVDLLLPPDGPVIRFESARLQHGMRGTGCMLSSAIAASLALGASLEDSVGNGKQYVFDAIAQLR